VVLSSVIQKRSRSTEFVEASRTHLNIFEDEGSFKTKTVAHKFQAHFSRVVRATHNDMLKRVALGTRMGQIMLKRAHSIDFWPQIIY